MTRYNHMYDIAFSLETTNETGEVSGETLRRALLERINSLTDDEVIEAVGMPSDTYEVE